MRFIPRGRQAARPASSARLRVEHLEDRTTPTVIPPGFSETVFASGLSAPTAMAVAPDGRLFVAEKGGTLRVVQNGSVLPTPFVSLHVSTSSERGLDGVALDPNFAANGLVYVYYTTDPTTTGKTVNRLSRFTASGNVAAGGETILLDDIPSIMGNHNGGALVFRPDGKLYIGVGESGVPANAPDLSTLAGKILRLNPDGSIPTDNPFFNTMGARKEIWARGLRNPFTMAVQPGTGVLFINDVGQNAFEEIDLGIAGADYGWPTVEGNTPPGVAGVTYPIYVYSHGTGPLQGNAITGGAFYNPASPSFPAQYVGDYFFADLVTNRIFVRDAATGTVTTFADPTAGSGVVDLDVLPDGRLLYLSINTGKIFQIAAVPPPPAPTQVIGVGTGPGVQAFVGALNVDGSTRFLVPVLPGYTGGLRVATGDVTGDGTEDVVAALGPGAPPGVGVFDGATGQLVATFLAFDGRFNGGLNVAVGDVTGDGRADIVVGTATRLSAVAVYDGATFGLTRAFFAFPGFTGGVTVAAGDVTGDGRGDIVVGAATAISGVTVFDGPSGTQTSLFLAFGPAPVGVNVGVAGGEIVAGAASVAPLVETFDAAGHARLAFFALPPGFPDGARVAGQGNLILAGSGPFLLAFDRATGNPLLAELAFGVPVPGGVSVG